MNKIALDPGHMGGSFSVLEDRHFQMDSLKPIKEGDLNLKVASKLKSLLEEVGFEVLLSRGSFEKYSPIPEDFKSFWLSNMQERASLINDFCPELTISIHFNSNCYSSDMFITDKNGVMTFVLNNDKSLVAKAKIIAKNLSLDFGLKFCKQDWFFKDVAEKWVDLGDGVNVRDLYILRNVKTPVVLSEGPFMNNLKVYKSLIKNEDLVDIYTTSLFKSIREIVK